LASEISTQEEKIKNDVKRSFSEHIFLKEDVSVKEDSGNLICFLKKDDKMQSMHRILRAYANLDPEVGYTQGMVIK